MGFVFLDFLTEFNGALQRILHQAFTGIAAHHGCCHFGRGYHGVERRSGGVHHVGFAEGSGVQVTLNVNHGSL